MRDPSVRDCSRNNGAPEKLENTGVEFVRSQWIHRLTKEQIDSVVEQSNRTKGLQAKIMTMMTDHQHVV